MAPHSDVRLVRRSVGGPHYQPLDWDPSLPYGGKVYLARRKKPDTWFCIFLEVAALSFVMSLGYWCYFHFDHFHFHVTKAYAHIGHTEAQHLVGQRYLHGRGVDKDHSEAMKWFKKAADQGHPHSSYNLAVGHLQGLHEEIEPEQAQKLIAHAARQGVPEASDMMESSCVWGNCDDEEDEEDL